MSEASVKETQDAIHAQVNKKAGHFGWLARKTGFAPSEKDEKKMATLIDRVTHDPMNMLMAFLTGGKSEYNAIKTVLEENGEGKWANEVAKGVEQKAEEKVGGGLAGLLGGNVSDGASPGAASADNSYLPPLPTPPVSMDRDDGLSPAA